MKRTIMLAFVAMAALTCTAAVGVSSAAAGETALCKSKESANSCAPANTYPSGTQIKATSTNAKFETSLGTVACGASAYNATSSAQSGEPLALQLNTWILDSCKLGATSCTVVGSSPSSWSLYGSEGGSGRLITDTPASWQVGCGALIAKCSFSAPGNFSLTGGNPAQLGVSQAMTMAGGLCPKTATFSASYSINSPAPLYVPASTKTTLCSSNTYGPLCLPASRYPSETAFSASLAKGTKATLETSYTTLSCETSALGGKTSAASGQPLGASVSSFSLGGCTGGASCTFEAGGTPFGASIAYGAGNNGTLTINGFTLYMSCGVYLSCAYKSPALSLTMHGGSPATLSASKFALEWEKWGSGLCPTNPKFSAEYEITSPSPLYVAHT